MAWDHYRIRLTREWTQTRPHASWHKSGWRERDRDGLRSSSIKSRLLPFPASWLQQVASAWKQTAREDCDVCLPEFLRCLCSQWLSRGVTLKTMRSRALGPSQTHSGLFWQHPGGAEPSIKKLGLYHSTRAAGEDGRLVQKNLETLSEFKLVRAIAGADSSFNLCLLHNLTVRSLNSILV